jgi:chromosomal replication initiator protein
MLEAFDGMINNSRGLTIQKIVSVVAKHYHIPSAEILGKSRKAEVVLPRQVAIYFSKTLLNVSLIDIGRHFGRDHSTIISSVKKIDKDAKTNQELNKVIYDLRKKITAQ